MHQRRCKAEPVSFRSRGRAFLRNSPNKRFIHRRNTLESYDTLPRLSSEYTLQVTGII